MDRWRKAYTYFGFENLDLSWERVLVYGTAAAFWINLIVWLLTQENELIFDVDNLGEWLTLTLPAMPGNIRVVFLIALGPNRRGE